MYLAAGLKMSCQAVCNAEHGNHRNGDLS